MGAMKRNQRPSASLSAVRFARKQYELLQNKPR